MRFGESLVTGRREPVVARAAARGISLLEVLIVAVMVSGVIVGVSLLFSKTSRGVVDGERRLIANRFAATRLGELQAKPYALVPLTTSGFSVSGFNPTAAGCDCAREDFVSLPVDGVFAQNDTTFARKTCIHLVQFNPVSQIYQSYCPDSVASCPSCPAPVSSTDFGLREIFVRVFWQRGSEPPSSLTVKTVVTR